MVMVLQCRGAQLPGILHVHVAECHNGQGHTWSPIPCGPLFHPLHCLEPHGPLPSKFLVASRLTLVRIGTPHAFPSCQPGLMLAHQPGSPWHSSFQLDLSWPNLPLAWFHLDSRFQPYSESIGPALSARRHLFHHLAVFPVFAVVAVFTPACHHSIQPWFAVLR